MVHYSKCPLCLGTGIARSFTAVDHTVSHEEFEVWKCDACSGMFTQDVPDQAAIGRYYKSDAYISHSDTQKGVVNRLYHLARKLTLAGKLKLISSATSKRSGSVLDIGAGTGAFLHTMKEGGWEIQGLEPDEGARKTASSLYGLNLLPPTTLFQLPATSFDAITAWHVFEHVHELHKYFDEVNRLLKPNGRFFMAVPNFTSLDAQLYGSDWAAYDVPRHLYHFSPASVRKLVAAHGLVIRQVKPMWFDSFYVSMLSEQYKTGKGHLVKAAFNGLRSNIKAAANAEVCSSLVYIIRKQG